MSERERFEAWAAGQGGVLRGGHCVAAADATWVAWKAWQAACPEGWQCVPVEPTDEMVEVASELLDGSIGGYEATRAIRAYRAMLSAAPKPGMYPND